MKKISYSQQWDYHRSHCATFHIRNKYVGGYQVEETDDCNQISAIYVAEEFRGKGYGKKILLEALEEGAERLYSDICLKVRRDNKVAIKLYKKNGFKIMEEPSKDMERYMWMELHLINIG